MSDAGIPVGASVSVSGGILPSPTPATFANPRKPSLADYLVFVRNYMAIAPRFLPDNSVWIEASYDVAIEKVNLALAAASPLIYTLAVYNYAGDRLINFALDQPGECFFVDLRKAYGLTTLISGLVQAASDNGTSQSFLNPEWAKEMTLTNLEMTRTPYGRTYLGFAQEYGRSGWGLT